TRPAGRSVCSSSIRWARAPTGSRSSASTEIDSEAPAMKTSTDRILTTHVGSIPRPESVRALLRARLGGQPIDEAELAAKATAAVTDVVRRQGEVGLDVVSDGEMSKT